MKLYNTLTRKKEVIRPLDKKMVRIYSCGPTVYNNAHIGNMRAYLFNDTLVRALTYLGFPVEHAMNITDVGHLTSDADAGEDKMDLAARTEQKSPLEIARQYEKVFFLDLKSLQVHVPKKIKRATETIRQQIGIIQALEKGGYTYVTEHAVYFDVSKFKQYGKLSGQNLDDKKALSREELIDDPQKRRPQDFALWLFTVGKHSHHILRWSSPWGEGFPGWHIECSAISRSLLGQPFDIHTGGVDHIGVHHENEIAQSVAAFGTPLAHIWMHNEHLVVDGKKMSKSIGNTYTLADIEKREYDPLAFRYFCLQAHYRSLLNFTWNGLDGAAAALQSLREFVGSVLVEKGKNPKKARGQKKSMASYETAFTNALKDDLNTAQTLAVVWKLVKDESFPLGERQALLLQFDEVLGLALSRYRVRSVPARVKRLVHARNEARRNKQFIQSDALRNDIEGLGYRVKDGSDGTYIHRII